MLQNLDEKDIIHLVCYSSDVTTVFENVSVTDLNLGELEKAVNDITANGYTDLWGGMKQGAELITKYEKDGYNNRLFLFSDGLVNKGEKNKSTILSNVVDLYRKKHIQISAFGLGNDFDEKLMKGIAEKGLGAYFFIENSAAIPSFVDFGLKWLQHIVGVNAVLTVKTINSASNFEFYGGYDVEGAILGDLRGDNVRSLLGKFNVNPTAALNDEVLYCEIVYQVNGATFKIEKTLSVSFTDDAKTVEEGRNADLIVKVALQESSVLDKKLGKSMKKGQTKDAIALQKQQIELLEGIVRVDTEKLEGHNKVAKLLDNAKQELTKLEQEGVTKKAQKEVHHRQYRARRG